MRQIKIRDRESRTTGVIRAYDTVEIQTEQKMHRTPNTKWINRPCSSPPTFPVTAVPVRKANTLIPPNQASRAKNRGEDLIPCICGATEDSGGNWLQCDSCHKWSHMECHNLSEGAAKDMKFKCHICEPKNSRGCFAVPPPICGQRASPAPNALAKPSVTTPPLSSSCVMLSSALKMRTKPCDCKLLLWKSRYFA